MHLYYNVLRYVTWALIKSESISKVYWKNLYSKVSSAMLMEYFLCDDVGGKRNMYEMLILT